MNKLQRSCESISKTLQREILLLKLGKVLSLKAARGPLQGIVAEAPAAAFGRDEAFFGAEHVAVSRLSGAGTKGAAFFNVFSEQHNEPPVLLFSVL